MPAADLKQGVVALSHWGVIRAQGVDATAFLQGQLTNDIATLGTSAARLAGYCSAKGRLLASFIVWRVSPDEVLLACSADLLAATLARLSMFVLRAKCKLSDASAEVVLHGVTGADALDVLNGELPGAAWAKSDHHGATWIRLPDAACVPRLLRAAAPAAPLPGDAIELEQWRWLEVCSGVPTIVAATADRFVPQMLNFELLNGVDFKKGCYPGQEVVARSQYRGTVKRRMFLYDCAAPARAGQEVFQSADPDQPCGMVVNAAPHPAGGSSLLVEVKLATLAEGTVHLERPGGAALQRRALPYEVPTDAA